MDKITLAVMEFWISAQKNARIFEDKKCEFGLDNFELNMYAELCNALEHYYRIQALKLDEAIENIKKEMEAKAYETDGLDSDSSAG